MVDSSVVPDRRNHPNLILDSKGAQADPGITTMGNEVWPAFGTQEYVLSVMSSEGESAWANGGYAIGTIPAPPADSFAAILADAGKPLAVLDLRSADATGAWLRDARLSTMLNYQNLTADWTKTVDGILFIKAMTKATKAP